MEFKKWETSPSFTVLLIKHNKCISTPVIFQSFFQGSQGSLGNGGYELQNNQDPESGAGPESMGGKGGQTGEDSIKTRPDSSAASQVPPRFNGMFGLFMGLFGKQGKEDTTAR